MTSIGNEAFYYCSSLTSITIPKGMTSIGDSAFEWCERLEDIYYGGTEEQWNEIDVSENNESIAETKVYCNTPFGYELEILKCSEAGSKTVVNAVITNNTFMPVTCTLYSAVYSPDGILKACGALKKAIAASGETEADIDVSCSLKSGDIIRTFMWTDGITALAKDGPLQVK